MRVPVILGLGMALVASAAVSQQNYPSAPKKKSYSTGAKSSSTAPIKPAGSSAAAKNLHQIEQGSGKMPARTRQSKPHAGSAALLKSKPTPPINGTQGGNMGTAGASTGGAARNPYKGRLKHKGK